MLLFTVLPCAAHRVWKRKWMNFFFDYKLFLTRKWNASLSHTTNYNEQTWFLVFACQWTNNREKMVLLSLRWSDDNSNRIWTRGKNCILLGIMKRFLFLCNDLHLFFPFDFRCKLRRDNSKINHLYRNEVNKRDEIIIR